MFELHFEPRFSETDALGHLNNTVLPIWFETARRPIFEFFTPNLDISKWRLILASITVDFIGQIFYGKDVLVKTTVTAIGNSSFTIGHTAFQDEKMVAKGSAVMIHFDYGKNKSVVLPDNIKDKLKTHLADVI
ncbi:MAG: acyl-CoA thioesterase [Bacteriovoracaceae bacterium]|nr:acyl-CoA thioesterase [Bacteriovoracaceae bacterium]